MATEIWPLASLDHAVVLTNEFKDRTRTSITQSWLGKTHNASVTTRTFCKAWSQFIEQDRNAHDLLTKNVAMLGAQGETVCWRTDAFRSSFHPKGCPDFLPYNLVFFDPPYKLAPKIQQGSLLFAALDRLASPELCAPDALLVLRCDNHAEFTMPAAWKPDQTHRVKSMMLYFFRYQPNGVQPNGDPLAVEGDVGQAQPSPVDDTVNELFSEPDEFTFL